MHILHKSILYMHNIHNMYNPKSKHKIHEDISLNPKHEISLFHLVETKKPKNMS